MSAFAYLYFLKREVRYLAPLIFDIREGAHAGRSQEYLMGRGEASASAQINSRGEFIVCENVLSIPLNFTNPSGAAHFRIKRKTNFHCHARRDRMARRSWYISRETRRAPIADCVTIESSFDSLSFGVSQLAIHFATRSHRRESRLIRRRRRFVVSFADHQIAGRIASKVLPAGVSIDSIGPIPIYLPQVFQLPRRIVENLLAGEFRREGLKETRLYT